MSFSRLALLFAVSTYLLVQTGYAQEQPVTADSAGNDQQSEIASDRPEPDSPVIEPVDTTSYPRLDYNAEPRLYIIGELKATGLTTMDPKAVVVTTGLLSGDSIFIPGDRLTAASKKLWDQRHFSDVRVVTNFREDTVDINFILKQRVRVSRWQFSGIKSSEIKDINEKLKLRRNSEYSEYNMANALRQIRNYYDNKAFRHATIDYMVDPDTLVPNNVNVTLVIDRKDKVKIKKFTFEGNENISDKRLASSFKKTNKTSINFLKSFKYKEENFEEDRQNLLSYYRSQGYRDAELLEDSLYDVNAKRIGIWMKVKEGRKYYFRDISWIGNSEFPTMSLNNMVQIRKGDTYDSETLGLHLGNIQEGPNDPSIKNLYSNRGYLAIDVYPAETVVGDSVDVQIRIIEGQKFTVRNVIIEGNTRTNDHVIRREIRIRPGDLYNRDLLLRTYQRLATMQQFDPATSFPTVVPNMQQNLVDIKYSLTEVPNDQLELSGGWGAGMFIASVGVNFTNVSLRNFLKKGGWRPYPAGDNQTLGVKIQSNGSYYRAASISFTEPWLGGKKPNSLSVSLYTSRETNAYYLGQKATKHFGTIGGSVGIGKLLNWPDPYFNMYMGLQWQTYNLKDWDYFIVKNGASNVFALTFSFGRNSVDDPYQYSTSGSDLSLSVAATPPYSLFDGLDYAGALTNNERYRWVEYHKWKLNAKWFFPLTDNRKLVLMARAQFGYLGYYNKNKLSPFEGFQMGGDGLNGYSMYGVETVGLRGYKNSELTPYADYGTYASIFSKYTFELRYPIVQQAGTMVYALTFLEAGSANLRLEDFKPFSLKRSAGVGLRLYLPVLGMIGVDWGYGFDQVNSSRGKASGANFHFTMGTQF